MPLIEYVPKNFSARSLDVIDRANEILEEYERQGYDLTLRQLFYQFVSRALIPNRDAEYKKLGSIVNDARLAGLIDWDHIVDRTRYLRTVSSWDSPAAIIRDAARGYQRDLWEDQDTRIKVWIEKDALVGVIERACDELRVPFLSCRGYTSQSEMWGASQRFYRHTLNGKRVKVLHLGDHDPSGIDMSRDIEDRIRLFMAADYARDAGYEDAEDEDAVEWTLRMVRTRPACPQLGAGAGVQAAAEPGEADRQPRRRLRRGVRVRLVGTRRARADGDRPADRRRGRRCRGSGRVG